jgi:hypothetical protein
MDDIKGRSIQADDECPWFIHKRPHFFHFDMTAQNRIVATFYISITRLLIYFIVYVKLSGLKYLGARRATLAYRLGIPPNEAIFIRKKSEFSYFDRDKISGQKARWQTR